MSRTAVRGCPNGIWSSSLIAAKKTGLSNEKRYVSSPALALIKGALSSDFELLDEHDGTGGVPDDASNRAYFVFRRP